VHRKIARCTPPPAPQSETNRPPIGTTALVPMSGHHWPALACKPHKRTPICTHPPKLTTSCERKRTLGDDPDHQQSKGDAKTAEDPLVKMTALKIDQLCIKKSGIDTCSSGDRCIGRYDGRHGGSQGSWLQWYLMQETCGEHAQGSVGAHPIGSTREPL
jgi:hypothetical protein